MNSYLRATECPSFELHLLLQLRVWQLGIKVTSHILKVLTTKGLYSGWVLGWLNNEISSIHGFYQLAKQKQSNKKFAYKLEAT